MVPGKHFDEGFNDWRDLFRKFTSIVMLYTVGQVCRNGTESDQPNCSLCADLHAHQQGGRLRIYMCASSVHAGQALARPLFTYRQRK